MKTLTKLVVIANSMPMYIQMIWIIPCMILGIAIFLLMLLSPIYLVALILVNGLSCNSVLGILIALAFGVLWGMLLPNLIG